MRRIGWTNIFQLVFAVGFCLSLSSCARLFGNGEPYGSPAKTADAQPSPFKPGSVDEVVEPISFFELDPNYTCIVAGQTEAIPSAYRRRIVVLPGVGAKLYGDVCNPGSGTTLSVSELRFIDDGKYLIYQTSVFQKGISAYDSEGRSEGLAETVCVSGSPMTLVAGAADLTRTSRARFSYLASGQKQTVEALLERSLSDNKLTYRGDLLTLHVRFIRMGAGFAGELIPSESLGLGREVAMECFMNPYLGDR